MKKLIFKVVRNIVFMIYIGCSFTINLSYMIDLADWESRNDIPKIAQVTFVIIPILLIYLFGETIFEISLYVCQKSKMKKQIDLSFKNNE